MEVFVVFAVAYLWSFIGSVYAEFADKPIMKYRLYGAAFGAASTLVFVAVVGYGGF